MAHIAILSVGINSHLNQCFRIAELLQARGHRVTFLSADETARPQVEAQPFPFLLLAEESRLNIKKRTSALEQLPRGRRYLRWAQKAALEREHADAVVGNRELDRILGELAPDLVLLDYELHGSISRVAGLGYPLMLIEYHCSPLRIGGIPFMASRRLPAGGRLHGALIQLEWEAALAKRRLYLLAARLYYRGSDWWSTLHRLARAYGFNVARETSRRHWHFLTYRRIPTLYAAPWEFDFPHDIPNRDFYLGPLISVSRKETWADGTLGDVLRRFDPGDPPRERRLVYCSMGSVHSDAGYLRRVIEAFGPHPEWELILAAGRGVAVEGLLPAPPHVHVVPYAPQLEVLRRADLMLTHAGPATIYECIYFGVPMLIYSTGFMEQNGNAARVAFHGLGLRGDLRKDTPEQIAGKVRRVLEDAGYRQNIRRMQKVVRAYQASDKVVKIMERALAGSPSALGWQPIR